MPRRAARAAVVTRPRNGRPFSFSSGVGASVNTTSHSQQQTITSNISIPKLSIKMILVAIIGIIIIKKVVF